MTREQRPLARFPEQEMVLGRSATTLADSRRWGEGVWLVLCRSALRGICWGARALASDDSGDRLERAETLLKLGGLGGAELGGPDRAAAVDWAKLGELERAWLAHELGARSR